MALRRHQEFVRAAHLDELLILPTPINDALGHGILAIVLFVCVLLITMSIAAPHMITLDRCVRS